MNKTKVAIIEKQGLVRECLALLVGLQPDFDVLGHWGSSDEALLCIAGKAVEVIVLSTSGQGAECVKMLHQLRQEAGQLRIIVLTNHPNLNELKVAFKSGASGYISKYTVSGSFLDAIREVKRGKTFVDLEMKEELVSRYLEREQVGELRAMTALTPREQEILLLLARGYKARDAASYLGLSQKTVETHKYRIMAKLSLSNLPELVQYAAGQGLLQVGLPELSDPAARQRFTLAEK